MKGLMRIRSRLDSTVKTVDVPSDREEMPVAPLEDAAAAMKN